MSDESPPARQARAALPVLLFASTLAVMAGSIITPVLEVIRGDLDVSGTAAGLIITAHGLAIAVTSPIVGRLIDRWGVRGPLAGGLVLYAVAGAAGLFTDGYALLIASRLVFGIGAAAVFSGTTVAMLSLYQGPQRDRVMGWRSTATSVGGVVWPLIGGALGGLSWHAPFGVYLVGVPIALAALLTLPNDRPAPTGKNGGLLPLLRTRPALIGYYALQAAAAVLLYGVVVFLPQRLAQIDIVSPFLVSLYTVAMMAAMSLVGLVYAKLRAAAGYPALLRTAAATWVAAFVLLGLVDQPWLVIVAPVLFGIGQGIAFPALTVLVGEAAPAELRGQATSLSGTANFAGQFFSPLILGPVIGATSITSGFLMAAGLSLLVLLALSGMRDTSRPAPGAEPAAAKDATADSSGGRRA
ncbi:ACDE family multidrug resistance protein [Streptomyces africanus]|uniref:ACDE family multidrug resistance protein n=1 Tax=Streptomyces africanus TaxID=231024 RepID=A0ABU0QPA2_9ACTN|nr:MFS transporter [Streptomyces africanus]MDQ0748257.1 ACDE family multidrug resistance protein [Streptomyces africanus]